MSGDVITEVNYLTNTTDGCPAWLKASSASVCPIANYGQEPTLVTIHDLRGKQNRVDLDTNALEVLKYEGSTQEEFEDGSEAQQAHYEEIGNIIKKHLGASRVILYHHVFHTRGTPLTGDQCNNHHRNPGFLVHSDIDGPGTRQ